MAEKMEFQAETKKLLNLMISSIYSEKEIFLRELISNSSDALDKLRFESLTNKALLEDDEKLEIRLDYDKEARTLTIHDNGIGMSKEEVITNIGTIAKSGTEDLTNKIKESGQDQETLSDLIGQFGVGFYSTFIVADKVVLLTRKAGLPESESIEWSSTGDGSYTIDKKSKSNRGTSITLFLKPANPEGGLDDFTESFIIEGVVKKYSDFISYPIIMKEEREEVEKDADGKEIEGGKKHKIIEDKVLNSMKPIWTRSKSDVKPEEYNEFYKHISHDWVDPLKVITFQAEGRIEYRSLLFIPAKAPFDMYYQSHKSGLRLYVKKILIADNLDELLPTYLRFIKGVVDSPSLPLNISREMLQKDIHLSVIRKGLTTKILSTLKDVFEKEREEYLKFWAEFGIALKEGVSNDFENKDKLTPILLFKSSFNTEKFTSLKEYVDRMPSSQKNIYYVTGDVIEVVENSPNVEIYKQKGYEVLYLLDPVDNFMAQSIGEFDGKRFISVEAGAEDLIDEKDKEQKEKEIKDKEVEMGDFLKAIKEKLNEHVSEVELTQHLISAPASIGADYMSLSPHLEKLLRKNGQNVPKNKKVLRLNAEHSIVKKLFDKYTANKDDASISEYSELLLGYAMLTEGGEIINVGQFTKLMAKMMEKSL